jgi:hypothetical protein
MKMDTISDITFSAPKSERGGRQVTKDIWTTNRSTSLPREFWLRAKALLTIMHATSSLDDLRIQGEPPSIRLHKLQGDRRD